MEKLPYIIHYDANIYNIIFIANHLTTIIPFSQRKNITLSNHYVDKIKMYEIRIGEEQPDRLLNYISQNGITFCYTI